MNEPYISRRMARALHAALERSRERLESNSPRERAEGLGGITTLETLLFEIVLAEAPPRP